MHNNYHQEQQTSQKNYGRIGEVAMLLFLRRPLTDIMTNCTFEKIRKPMATEKRRRVQRSVCKRKNLSICENWLAKWNKFHLYVSYKRKLAKQLSLCREIIVYIGKNSYRIVRQYRTEIFVLSGTVLHFRTALFEKFLHNSENKTGVQKT